MTTNCRKTPIQTKQIKTHEILPWKSMKKNKRETQKKKRTKKKCHKIKELETKAKITLRKKKLNNKYSMTPFIKN